MQFLSLLLLATASMASPLHVRDLTYAQAAQDLSTVTGALESIGTAVEKCTTAITGWDGQAGGVDGIITLSNGILDEMKKATSTISSTATLGLADATAIVAPANALSAKVEGVTSALVAKKATFEKLGVTKKVTDALTAQKGGADALQKAIVGKLPALAGPVAGPIAKQFGDKLDAALKQLGG